MKKAIPAFSKVGESNSDVRGYSIYGSDNEFTNNK